MPQESIGYRAAMIARVVFPILALVALVAQFTRSFDDPFLTTGGFFSLFTNQSNMAAAIVLAIGAWRMRTGQADSLRWDLVRGAMVAIMATTGIVYATLPTSANTTGIHYNYQWATDVLHQLMPIVVLLDWIIIPPAHRLTFRRALVWTVYPLTYCAYSLVRGPFVDWYPYPFLDPRDDGWGMVGVYVVGISAGFLLFTGFVIVVGNLARTWWAGRNASPLTAGSIP